MALIETAPTQLTWRDRVRDIGYKTFWTVVFVALSTAGVMVADLPAQWIVPVTGVLQIVGGHLRQLAGAYAPPPAQDVQALR